MRIAIFRKSHFNAAHRLHNPKWSDEKNKEIFGLCNNANYHGHNYDLEVKVVGEVNPETGYLMDLKYLKDVIKEHVEDKLDHKNLNLDVPELEGIMPSTENLCYFIWNILQNELGSEYEVTVRLWETPRNFAEYPA
jgi:6-pyruvoyltetrahydropterin/6-carboxytetrahydropterin synthase